MTGDPTRDDHATGHPFGVPDSDAMEPNEYADHQRREERCDYVGGCSDNRCLLTRGHDGGHLMRHESED